MDLILSNSTGNAQCPKGFVPNGTSYDTTVNTGSGNYATVTNKNFHYEVEVSRNSYNFTSIGSIEKNKSTDHTYKYLYSATGDDGFYFFRIKQIYSNGYTLFTGIKSIELERTTIPGFTIYPNPSSGIVGIKFDDIQSGKILVLISNAQGQSVVKKDFEVLDSSYRQIATLQRGIYWLRLSNEPSVLCQSTFY